MTSVEQAAHYIKNPQPKVSHTRKVVLSTSLNVQLHVILTGENENEIEEEVYEEWDEEMLDDDVDDAPIECIPIADETDDDDKPLQPAKLSSENNSSENEAQSSNASNNVTHVNKYVVPDRQSSRGEEVPAKSKVLRVFAGNVDVGASYHSLRVIESTSVAELLNNAMEKFHISQIETKHGRNHGKNSCVEYFLTVKTRDGDEITLDPKDKPYAIYESLTTHLTTPMPSLTQFRQLASTANNQAIKKKKRKSASLSAMGDSTLQFFMHKRIKRVNDKSGQVHIKVSLMTSTNVPATTEKMNAIRKMTSLRFNKKKSKKEASVELERIDKMIATSANITIADLTSIALVKFHIISDKDQSHQYKLVLNSNGKGNILCSLLDLLHWKAKILIK